MHYYLYELKNLINGKIYVGVHKTATIDDGYMGSGKVSKVAIEKHGIENFSKTILEEFENAEQMFAREAEVVNEAFLAREDVYNLRRGGTGGFDYINSSPGVDESRRLGGKVRAALNKEYKLRQYSPTYVSAFSDPMIQSKIHAKSMTPEANAKRIASFRASAHAQGSKNSQYGTMWITNEINNIKISKDSNVPEGWRKGRVVKNSV
jgi:hypothetical protein